jgi:hypothetical protein
LIFRSTLAAQSSEGPFRPAFDAIAEVQQQAVPGDWYVSQTDHGRVAGQIAAAFDSLRVPDVHPLVAKAIALHDMGWLPFDGELGHPRQPELRPDGAPVSFIHAAPKTFLAAWQGSIQAAQSTGALGGLLVSAHLARLANPWLESGSGTPEERAEVEAFVFHEAERVERLLPHCKLPLEQVQALLQAVQLCDLMSLYLCANPKAAVEFPQLIEGGTVTMKFEDNAYRMRPNLMDHVVIMEIPCVRWVDGKAEKEIVPVKVQ